MLIQPATHLRRRRGPHIDGASLRDQMEQLPYRIQHDMGVRLVLLVLEQQVHIRPVPSRFSGRLNQADPGCRMIHLERIVEAVGKRAGGHSSCSKFGRRVHSLLQQPNRSCPGVGSRRGKGAEPKMGGVLYIYAHC